MDLAAEVVLSRMTIRFERVTQMKKRITSFACKFELAPTRYCM
jgi:hypothetical protein